MKNKFYLFFIIISFLLSFDGDMHDFYLPNGLKVIIYEKHTYPTVALNVIYDIGSHDDPIGKKGLAHVMANLMFEGSKNYKKHEHNSLISSTGGSSSFTHWQMIDYLEFSSVTTVDHFELLLNLESDRLFSLLINSETVTNAINSAISTIKEEMESSFWEVEKALLSIYPNNHPYSYSQLGNIEDLENLFVDDCQKTYDKYFTPNNAILTIVGDIDPLKKLEIINKYFGGSKLSTSLPKNPNLSLEQRNNNDEISMFYPNNWPMNSYVQAYSMPIPRNEDFLILDLIASVLRLESSPYNKFVSSSDNFTRGFSTLRQRLGNGFFAFILESDSGVEDDLTKHEEAIEKFVTNLKNNGIESSLFKTAIKKQKLYLLDNNYDSKWTARNLGLHEIYQGNYKTYFDNTRLYEKFTNEDIKRVAKKYFINDYKFGIIDSD